MAALSPNNDMGTKAQAFVALREARRFSAQLPRRLSCRASAPSASASGQAETLGLRQRTPGQPRLAGRRDGGRPPFPTPEGAPVVPRTHTELPSSHPAMAKRALTRPRDRRFISHQSEGLAAARTLDCQCIKKSRPCRESAGVTAVTCKRRSLLACQLANTSRPADPRHQPPAVSNPGACTAPNMG